MKPEEATPLAQQFRYLALGHGHKPYVISTPEGRPYAFNPGAPERVNFGEEKYDKGYWLVTVEAGKYTTEFRQTSPRPMTSLAVNLEGAADVEQALDRLKAQLSEKLNGLTNAASDRAEDNRPRPFSSVRAWAGTAAGSSCRK